MIQKRIIKVAVCQLNVHSLDFENNSKKIIESIKLAKEAGATIRLGSELEITGSGCEDHFLEPDTVRHAWEILAEIISTELTNGILCVFGMPIIYNDVIYDCLTYVYNKEIILIRPKMDLADDGNYREGRWFTDWKKKKLEEFSLPTIITNQTKQKSCPIGVAIIQAEDTKLFTEICEEMWTVSPPSETASLGGAEIFLNGSSSHFQPKKYCNRIQIINSITRRLGGLYLYANNVGCDGGRLYFDGGGMASLNGSIIEYSEQFPLNDIDISYAIVDLDDISEFRLSSKSRTVLASRDEYFNIIKIPYFLCKCKEITKISQVKSPKIYSYNEELSYAAPFYLWDYLRKSGATAFFVPLSGGIDSATVAMMAFIMCHRLYEEIKKGNKFILAEVRKVLRDNNYIPSSPQELCSFFLFTAYLGSKNSSTETRGRSRNMSKEIGSTHFDATIHEIIEGYLNDFQNLTSFHPKYTTQSGTYTEDLALQNVQARSRMVFSYMMAQLLPVMKGRQGFVIMLGTGNVDEGLRGYLTKYDCSSSDINPIGGLNKIEIRSFAEWAANYFKMNSLMECKNAISTAELRPAEIKQNDEEEMGFTFDELNLLGKLRKMNKCGPVSMFEKLVGIWTDRNLEDIAVKVKRFFVEYSKNRHKMTTLTPSCHLGAYSDEDHRYDLRPFLYNIEWKFQFKKIDEMIQIIKKEKK